MKLSALMKSAQASLKRLQENFHYLNGIFEHVLLKNLGSAPKFGCIQSNSHIML